MAAVARLQRRPDFLRVAGSRRKWVAPGLILQAAPQPIVDAASPLPYLRVGFTVSRKVGNAVARNRARRRLRAAAGEVLPGHAAPGHDYVVVGRLGTLTRSYPALVGDLVAALQRLGVYRAAARP